MFFNSAFQEPCGELPPHTLPLETRTNNLHALFRSQGTLPKALWMWVVQTSIENCNFWELAKYIIMNFLERECLGSPFLVEVTCKAIKTG